MDMAMLGMQDSSGQNALVRYDVKKGNQHKMNPPTMIPTVFAAFVSACSRFMLHRLDLLPPPSPFPLRRLMALETFIRGEARVDVIDLRPIDLSPMERRPREDTPPIDRPPRDPRPVIEDLRFEPWIIPSFPSSSSTI